MKNLRDSIIFLLAYFSLVFGVSQVEGFENNVLNFQAAFFIMLALATILGVLGPSRIKISRYSYLIIWTILYVFVWAVYWRFLAHQRSFEELVVQFLLIEIGAGLAYAIGEQISQIDVFFDGFSSSAYPNRTMDMYAAHDRISAELNRSRRYNRPLSVLVLEFDEEDSHQKDLVVQRDLLRRITFAKAGQILGDYARATDLILNDKAEHFVIVCPETDYQAAFVLVERICAGVKENLNTFVKWGTASFPNEALTFDDLIETAYERIGRSAAGESVRPTSSSLVADEVSYEGD